MCELVEQTNIMFTCKLEWTPILIWKYHNWRITKSEEPIWGLDWIEGSLQNFKKASKLGLKVPLKYQDWNYIGKN
jgi:hypothetical protein